MKYLIRFNEASLDDIFAELDVFSDREVVDNILDTLAPLMEETGFRLGEPKTEAEYLDEFPYYTASSISGHWQINIMNIPGDSNGLSRMYDKVLDIHNSMERRSKLALDVKTGKTYGRPGYIYIKPCSGPGCGQYHRKGTKVIKQKN